MTGLPSGFPVQVRLLSDWIVGTGEGRVGDVDATVRRDGDGLPFVPANTLPPAVRAACRARPARQAAAVLVRPGVMIDEESGVARDEMFRLEERARPAMLEAHAEFAVPGDGDLPVAAELLLRAGAAAVDGLGGKRNRGAGRCWLLLPGMTEANGSPPVPAAPRPADARLAGALPRAHCWPAISCCPPMSAWPCVPVTGSGWGPRARTTSGRSKSGTCGRCPARKPRPSRRGRSCGPAGAGRAGGPSVPGRPP